jgi:hypothetical protein
MASLAVNHPFGINTISRIHYPDIAVPKDFSNPSPTLEVLRDAKN